MSIYSTLDITREEAERMVLACRMRKDRRLASLTNEELDKELHEYVYSHDYEDIVGGFYNYIIKEQ